jgi:2-haloacid dehalogenase
MDLHSPTDSHPKAVLFDLLTALLDSWSLWNAAAGDEARGRAWRAEYLRLTYGCGNYVPYEDLVRQAAERTGLPAVAAGQLESNWGNLRLWSGAQEALAETARHCKIAVVTNCSQRLGRQAASLVDVTWDAVVTAEEAGCYKPDPRPYHLAMRKLGVEARDCAFVAGSGYDMFGTARVSLRTYWHNRVALPLPEGAPMPEIVSPTLDELPNWLRGFTARSMENS